MGFFLGENLFQGTARIMGSRVGSIPRVGEFLAQFMGSIPTQHREEFRYLLIVAVIPVYKANDCWVLDVLTKPHPYTG